MDYKLKDKFLSPHAAAQRAVKSGDWVDYGFGAGFPSVMDSALAARKDELSRVNIRGGLAIVDHIAVAECDREKTAFSYHSWHIGDYERTLRARGLCSFMPVILRNLPQLYRKCLRVDAAFVPVSLPDEKGYCSLGISNYAWHTIIKAAHTVVFEINEHLPTLKGVDGSHQVHLSDADYIVEGEHDPLPTRTYKQATQTDIQIATHVVNEIPDGAVLSLGVGGVPFAIANMLAQSDIQNLGCHTGTISDAFMALYQAGKLTNSLKQICPNRSAWNLAIGSQALYQWLRDEPTLFHPADIDFIHSPTRIAQMDRVISINGGVQVDLMGQENAESAGARQLSGTGGQLDFLEGAFHSSGGKGFICLHAARTDKQGTLISNIVPFIPDASVVSAPRGMTEYIATEYGIARLSGLNLKERAEQMISIAHPQFRNELAAYAQAHLN